MSWVLRSQPCNYFNKTSFDIIAIYISHIIA